MYLLPLVVVLGLYSSLSFDQKYLNLKLLKARKYLWGIKLTKKKPIESGNKTTLGTTGTEIILGWINSLCTHIINYHP